MLPIFSQQTPPIPAPALYVLRDALAQQETSEGCTHHQLREVAQAAGFATSWAYVASQLVPGLMVAKESELSFQICVSSCQGKGSVGVLDSLIEERDRRENNDEIVFDIRPRGCIDLCPMGPVVVSRGPGGQAMHPKLRPAEIKTLVANLCDQ